MSKVQAKPTLEPTGIKDNQTPERVESLNDNTIILILLSVMICRGRHVRLH